LQREWTHVAFGDLHYRLVLRPQGEQHHLHGGGWDRRIASSGRDGRNILDLRARLETRRPARTGTAFAHQLNMLFASKDEAGTPANVERCRGSILLHWQGCAGFTWFAGNDRNLPV
jgi:hypothetical protein